MKWDMIQELAQLGLTNGEARVYLSLLKIGLSKVGPIVRDSHVSYSKIYDVLCYVAWLTKLQGYNLWLLR